MHLHIILVFFVILYKNKMIIEDHNAIIFMLLLLYRVTLSQSEVLLSPSKLLNCTAISLPGPHM